MAISLNGNRLGRASHGNDNDMKSGERLTIREEANLLREMAREQIKLAKSYRNNRAFYILHVNGAIKFRSDAYRLVNADHAIEQATALEPAKETNGLEGLESLFTNHNEAIKGTSIYKNFPANCGHNRETGAKSGMQCRDCGRVREPEGQFENELVARYNPRGTGYVNYK